MSTASAFPGAPAGLRWRDGLEKKQEGARAMQRLIRGGGIVLAVGLIALGSAQAFVTRLTPLKDVLAENKFICVLRVEKIDPKRPGVVFQVDEDLKGKFPYRRLPVNLTGDTDAQKLNHTAELLKRLSPKLPLVLFCNQRGPRFT